MMRALANVFRLGVKELRSLYADPVLLLLMLYIFTVAIYQITQNVHMEVTDAAVAIVDEDRSRLSHRIADAVLPPQFKQPVELGAAELDMGLERGDFVFALTIPHGFERDLMAGRRPALQLDVDATAMSMAGNGAVYLETIVLRELAAAQDLDFESAVPFRVVTRAAFNPNLGSRSFMAIMQLVENITILAVILTGAAFIREREHGTIEHLLVMPVTPLEIMVSKVWSMGLVVLAASALSIVFVVKGWLAVAIDGSVALFLLGAALQLFATTSMGIFLATVAGSMPQFGLLLMMTLLPLQTLSGSMTPRESMPQFVQDIMLAAPNTHFVMLAQAILFRGAGLESVWPQLLALAVIGSVFFVIALRRFRAFLT